MSGFIGALIKQRRDAKKAGPDTSGRLKEIIDIIRKYDYDDGITPEIVVGIIQDLGPTFVTIGQIASQQAEYIPAEYADALVDTLFTRLAHPHNPPMHVVVPRVLNTRGSTAGVEGAV